MKLPILVVAYLLVNTTANNVKEDFIKKMDGAMQHKQSLADLQQRLLAVAVPRDLSDSSASSNDLDLSQYALKYVGCQNIKSFSDELAEDSSAKSVLALSKFVIFRFCQANLCSSYNKYGCSENYGEYLIDMETYLVTMAEYHYSRYKEYCTTCISCMSGQSRWLENVNATDDSILNEAVSSTDDTTTTSTTTKSSCKYEAACENYKSACSNYKNSNTTYEDYFTCTAFTIANNVAYLGPHCSKNGETIQIGIFNDVNCTEYIGDIVNIETFTGMTFDSNGLSFYDTGNCISCVEKDEYYLYENGSTGDGVYDLCTALYDTGGKCNRYLNVADTSDTYSEDNELKVCNFIESLVENHYDEYGEIIVGNRFFNPSNWNNVHEYYNAAQTIQPLQIFGLVASITLVLSLSVYSWYLRSKISKTKTFYYITKSKTAMDAGRISRIQSGIVTGRSQSYADYNAYNDGSKGGNGAYA